MKLKETISILSDACLIFIQMLTTFVSETALSKFGNHFDNQTLCALQFQRGKYNLPSHDALAQILPDNQLLRSRAKTELPGTAQLDQNTKAERADSTENKPNINSTYQVPHPHMRYGAKIYEKQIYLIYFESK